MRSLTPLLTQVTVPTGKGLIRGAWLLVASGMLAGLGGHGSAVAASISQGFFSKTDLSQGTVVSLDSDDPHWIEPANINNADYLYGIATTPTKSTLTISERGTTVQVATVGETAVFVSDINGSIKKGDMLSVSQVDGIAAKAIDPDSNLPVLGIASGDFTDASEGATKRTLTGLDGKEISVGVIQVQLILNGTTYQPNKKNSLLLNVSQRLTGKEVGFAQAVIATALFLFAIVLSMTLMLSGVRNSFISIGRNPLASVSIYRSLFRVSLFSIVLFVMISAVAYVTLLI